MAAAAGNVALRIYRSLSSVNRRNVWLNVVWLCTMRMASLGSCGVASGNGVSISVPASPQWPLQPGSSSQRMCQLWQ